MPRMIKVCGMRDQENIKQIALLQPDLMGFIFYPRSSRYVRKSGLQPSFLNEILPSNGLTKRVGVFVESPDKEVERTAKNWQLDFIQLHGKESPAFCSRLKDKGHTIIKVFSVGKEGIKPEIIALYEPFVDLFLFDTQTPKYGGSGRKFDWTTLENYESETPFILSGGISAEDASNLKSYKHPKCVGFDVNSKFEDAPALKNPELLKSFISTLRKSA